VPVSGHDGKLHGLQFIYDKPLSFDPTRNKTFTAGLAKKGHFHLIGTVSPFSPICFAEGHATGASIHQATGYAVVVCFDADNLWPVVESWRKQYSNHPFIIGADNDQWKPDKGNTGLDKATQAAKAFGCCLSVPDFTGWDVDGNKPTDFNDLHLLAGVAAVKAQVEGAQRPADKQPEDAPELVHGCDRMKISEYGRKTQTAFGIYLAKIYGKGRSSRRRTYVFGGIDDAIAQFEQHEKIKIEPRAATDTAYL